MATILILGAGVMGSALSVPGADNGHDVLLAGTPLDDEAVRRMKKPGGVHPKLDHPLPDRVTPLAGDELTAAHVEAADIIVVGVSSPGIPWAVGRLNALTTRERPVAFVTKGLDRAGASLSTLAESLPMQLPGMKTFLGIGGPCIARELANRNPTASVYASADGQSAAKAFAVLMATDYYRLSTTDDVTGVEACAALKNFFAIGVAAMQTRYPDAARADGQSKNPTAAAFTQAALEMARLCERFGGRRDTAFDLAGIGDLHVTVGGGRNSKLGHGLGLGRTVSDMMTKELAGETVEGIDTARMLSAWLEPAPGLDPLERTRFPLAMAIMDAVLQDKPFVFDFQNLTVS
ncbi:glycerol-3-phosphate dehydrogenase [Mesorhizobium sp. LHD-90]|uniref:glycerol-3-phosphate dehydrogenase n=1 Tax=Mesorhizobium sp. LHD-90 TaxID=3071414 RepID=UPI0027DF2D8C|nr:glycerol-3-phosphate dehydrogenase [Mesorhizobium sp. LHD-90]MDQ6437477.1 glycerol-3-phosphate dehydrogenase [Mesorhizobium sp. LHD-90]